MGCWGRIRVILCCTPVGDGSVGSVAGSVEAMIPEGLIGHSFLKGCFNCKY